MRYPQQPSLRNEQIIMKRDHSSQSGLFNPRVLLAFALCSAAVLLAMLGSAATPAATSGTCVAVPMGINACPTWVSIYDYLPTEGTAFDADGAVAEALSPAGDRVFVTASSGDPTATHNNGTPGGTNIATVAYDVATGAQL